MDNELLQNKETKLVINMQNLNNSNLSNQKTPCEDLYDLTGWSKHDGHNGPVDTDRIEEYQSVEHSNLKDTLDKGKFNAMCRALSTSSSSSTSS